MSITAEQMLVSAEKFENWLRKKYPVIGADVKYQFKNAPHLRKPTIYATIWPLDGRVARVEVSIGRPAGEVLRSIAHEWKHVLQLYNEGIPATKIKMKQEIAAMGFAATAVARYKKQVGNDW